jgi:hypothetical protein
MAQRSAAAAAPAAATATGVRAAAARAAAGAAAAPPTAAAAAPRRAPFVDFGYRGLWHGLRCAARADGARAAGGSPSACCVCLG